MQWRKKYDFPLRNVVELKYKVSQNNDTQVKYRYAKKLLKYGH